MNTKIKNTLIFLSGAACGAGGVWYFVSNYYKKKYQEQYAEMEKFVTEKYADKPVGAMGVTEESKRVVEQVYKSHVNAEKELIASYKESIPANGTSYNTIGATTQVETPNHAPASGVETVEEDAPEEDEERDPYLISVEEYGDIEPYYDKMLLFYDKSDDTLVDSQTEELMSVAETIGQAVYEKLDKFKDGTYVYVRNDKISTDYEIEVRDLGNGEL